MKPSHVAAAVCLFSSLTFAQEFRGTITGVVTDASGGHVVGAKIAAVQSGTGSRTQTTSDSTGQYTIPFLNPGKYDVSAQMPGFKEFVRKDLSLDAGDHLQIDIKLEVGDASQTVDVTADSPLLNTENASTGQTITTKEVEEMPLNGRTPLMLSQLAIGVIATGTPTLVHPFDAGGPSAVSIGGTPSQTSEILMNGAPTPPGTAAWPITRPWKPCSK